MKFPWRYWKLTLLLASSIDFFSVCFDTGFIPDEWNDSVTTPIPVFCGRFAKSTKLQRHQLGACMLQALLQHFKLTWVDDNNLLCDEQNGFRKSRTTLDHLSTVMSLTETQKALKKDIYVAFIDFSKAYDSIPRHILWENLKQSGICGQRCGHLYNAIISLYTTVKSCVGINGISTNFFDFKCGLKQGCLLSPLLFSLYVNDLIQEMK